MKVKELAEILHLSPSTVSLVLNGRPGISDETRKKVKDAVVELGCEDMFNIKEKKQGTLLFVVYRKNVIGDDKAHYFSQVFSEIIEGVEHQAKNRDFHLMITYTDEQRLEEELIRISEVNADGILLLATEMKEGQINNFLKLGIPTVMIDNYMLNHPCDCVTINNEMGVYDAISYLKELGHKKIGYLHIVQNAKNFEERYYAFLSAMKRVNLTFEEKLILQFNTSAGNNLRDKLLKELGELKEMPTAFFADNDIMAIFALQALKKLGYKVPEDVSLIGFDNMPMSEMMETPLTTIYSPKKKLGVAAVNLLIDKMEESSAGSFKMEISTSLIVRKSVRKSVRNVREEDE